MKNNQFTGVLMLLLLVSTLASAYLIFKWNNYFHRQADVQGKLIQMNESRAVMQQLFAETGEFSKTANNKELTAIIQQFSTPPAGAVMPAAAPRPAAPKSGK